MKETHKMKKGGWKHKVLSGLVSVALAVGMTPAVALAAPTANGDGLQDDLQSYDSATSVWDDNDGDIDINYDTIGGTWTAPDESVHNNGTYLVTLPKLIQYLEMQAGIVDVNDNYTVNVKGILPSGKQVVLAAETGKTLSANGTSPITETTTQEKTIWSADDAYGDTTIDKILGTDCTDNIKLSGVVNGSAEYTGYVAYTATMENGYQMLNATPSYTGTEPVVFRSSAPLASLVNVKMDGAIVDPSNYDATEGSTVITFHDDYVKTLPSGNHTVTINNGSSYGEVSANFKIIEVSESNNPAVPSKTPAELAAEYQTAYEAASMKGNLGSEVIWWLGHNNYTDWTIHVAPVNGCSGIISTSLSTSPFNLLAADTSLIFEPGVVAGSNLNYLFNNCIYLTDIDVSNLDTSSVTSMGAVFSGCSRLKTVVGLDKWDTSKVTLMTGMFANCLKLITLDGISNWNVRNVTSMNNMFSGCKLLSVDCSNWDVSSVTNHNGFNNQATGVISPIWIF